MTTMTSPVANEAEAAPDRPIGRDRQEIVGDVPPIRPSPSGVPVGRLEQRAALSSVVDRARAGRSGAVLLRGAPGSGKTRLLSDAASGATDCRVLRAAGVEVEHDLPFGALQQLCGPLVVGIEQLPAPQAEALGVAFGLLPGSQADPFLVGIGLVSLLSEAAATQPVVCIVDDAEWVDAPSAHALCFAARRLDDVGVAFLVAVSGSGEVAPLAGLDEVRLPPLSVGESQLLLTLQLPARLDARIRDRILAEARGNPSVIGEFADSTSVATVAGGLSVAGTSASSEMADTVASTCSRLSSDVFAALLLAAAEPLGDPTLLQKAFAAAGTSFDARRAAEATGLIDIGGRVLFVHPVVRSLIYAAASDLGRREAHRLLADVCDTSTDPDLAAWHRAQSNPEPLEEVAIELEQASDRARWSGGLGAAAAILEQAHRASEDPRARVRRGLDAAVLKHHSGAFHDAIRLVDAVQFEPLDERDTALVQLVRANVSVSTGHVESIRDLAEAAGRLTSIDGEKSTATYLWALEAATSAGRLGPHGGVHQIAAFACTSSKDSLRITPVDHLLDALAAWWSGAEVSDHQDLARALDACCADASTVHPMATRTAMELWHEEAFATLAQRGVDAARRTGASADLPRALDLRACWHVLRGDFGIATSVADEAANAAGHIGAPAPMLASILIAGWRSNVDSLDWIDGRVRRADTESDGNALTVSEYCSALVHNASGRYEQAFHDAQAVMRRDEPFISAWAAPEVVEAAVRAGRPDDAAQALECVRSTSAVTGSSWAHGIEHRCDALLAEGDVVDEHFTMSIRHLEMSGMRLDLARTHLLYGEWLRRQKRRVEARSHLRTALQVFDGVGAVAFADRASLELRASGEQARKRSPETIAALTERESQIAELASDGLSNPEIGSQLFISSRTVEYHLHKVFSKLGITARAQLRDALPG